MLPCATENSITPFALPPTIEVEVLRGEHEVEVLDFLAADPLSSFVMASWIKDNGLVSPLNRGTFYACRDARKELEGVALIGHITLFEAVSNSALAAFAGLARGCKSVRTILGPEDKVNRFLVHYADADSHTLAAHRQLLFEQRSRSSAKPVAELRRATQAELSLIVPVHAAMAIEQTGIDPLATDREGFRERCLRRIQQGRVWVCVEDQQLTFKADVIADLTDVAYLEGIYVSPGMRGSGYGARCLRELTNRLLSHARSVCVLAREENESAQSCYRSAGYKFRDYYKTLLVRRTAKSDAEEDAARAASGGANK